MVIQESGMQFGPFDPADCWPMEKSVAYTAMQEGVKVVEFGWLRQREGKPPQLWLVEAKSSSPNPGSPEPGAAAKLDTYFRDIGDKMINALGLALAACLGRHSLAKAEVPANWQTLNLSTSGVRFVLVIRGHKLEWLAPLQARLNIKLHALSRVWALGSSPALVLNEEMAHKYGLMA